MKNITVSTCPIFDDDYNFIISDEGEIMIGVSVFDTDDDYLFFDQTLPMCDFMRFLVLLNNIVSDDVMIEVWGYHHGEKELKDMWEIFENSNLRLEIEHG